MVRLLTRWLAVALLLLAVLPASAGSTSAFTLSAQSYPGSRDRQYKVYVPDGLSGPAPMVMVLHGCQQTNDDVLRDWGLVAAADRYRFILVAPFITSYDGLRNTNCWGFWLDQHRHEGRGEPEDLHQIGRQVESRFGIDPKRRYVTGLSSGGAMAVVLSVTHNEYFAAAASASGLPYGEDAASVSFSGCPGSATFHAVSQVVAAMRAERNHTYPIPLMVLQNNKDCTVIQPAGRNIRDAQLQLDGDAAHNTPARAQARQRPCTPVFSASYECQQIFYTGDAQPDSRSLVETVFFDGPIDTPNTTDTNHGHYWIGGQDGRDGPWALQKGPSYPDIVWEFFSRHAMDTSPPWPHPACNPVNAAPGAHVGAGRAVAGGYFNLRALSTGDMRDIGFAWDFYFSQVRLFEGTAGRWFAQPPAGCT
ncbi:PHB depolymerase family esterase [Variovorax sp. J22R24]|uniref:extracellular catalytic domain type 1 short-chain-length polyhydroxyalkanoate depolymerase n=1 Tax=Variovorax gracilis TaxID=3053502 RepID=UPI002575824E|nr:PHB depolymerase family esterase [Variovorax sp. J22R24]MDM0107577.1 PHB depolymerase family esterase [Variovorax sp. J22R24]